MMNTQKEPTGNVPMLSRIAAAVVTHTYGGSIHNAAKSGNLVALRALITHQADVNVIGIGCTPLDIAAQEQHVSAMKLLLRHGAALGYSHPAQRMTPLHSAVIGGSIEAITLLLSLSTDSINTKARTKLNGTPLFSALHKSNPDILHLLINHGADVNVPNSRGNTPLHSAVLHNRWDMLQVLIENGANTFTFPNSKKEIPIMIRPAITRSSKKRKESKKLIFESLCQMGNKDPNSTAYGGETLATFTYQRTPLSYWKTLVDRELVTITNATNKQGYDLLSLILRNHLMSSEIDNSIEYLSTAYQFASFPAPRNIFYSLLRIGSQNITKLVLSHTNIKLALEHDNPFPQMKEWKKKSPYSKQLLTSIIALISRRMERRRLYIQLAIVFDEFDNVAALLEKYKSYKKFKKIISSPSSYTFKTAIEQACSSSNYNSKLIDLLIHFGASLRDYYPTYPDSIVCLALNSTSNPHDILHLISKQEDWSTKEGKKILDCIIKNQFPLALGHEICKRGVHLDDSLRLAFYWDHQEYIDMILCYAQQLDSPSAFLRIAVTENKLGRVKLLLSKGIMANLNDLLLQCLKKTVNFEMANILLANGATLTNVDVYGNSLLFYVLHSPKYLQWYSWLQSKGRIDLEQTNLRKRSIFHCLCLEKYNIESSLTILALLITLDSYSPSLLNVIDDEGNTPLHITILSNGNLDLIKFLIENGSNINALGKGETSPLLLAVKESDMSKDDTWKVIEYLLDAGADSKLQSERKESVVKYAASNCPLNLFHRIYKLDPVPLHSGENYRDSILRLAVEGGNLSVVEWCLESGANFRWEIEHERESPLHVICMRFYARFGNRYEIAKLLVEHPGALQGKDVFERIPLHLAVEYGFLDLVQLFISQGSSINQLQGNGFSPLMVAAKHGHCDVARFLVENGANLNTTDKLGNNVLLCAAMKKKVDIIRWLMLGNLIPYDSTNNAGDTLESIAIQQNIIEDVKLIFKIKFKKRCL